MVSLRVVLWHLPRVHRRGLSHDFQPRMRDESGLGHSAQPLQPLQRLAARLHRATSLGVWFSRVTVAQWRKEKQSFVLAWSLCAARSSGNAKAVTWGAVSGFVRSAAGPASAALRGLCLGTST